MIIMVHSTVMNLMNNYFKGHDLALEQSYKEIGSEIAWSISELVSGIRNHILIARNRDNDYYNSVIDSMSYSDWLIHPVGYSTYLYLSYKSFVVMIEFNSNEFKTWHSHERIQRIETIVHEYMDAGNGTFYTDRNDS